MAPSNPHVAAQLKNLIYYHLDNNLLSNALFLATRLYAFEPKADSAYLLALCHLRNRDLKSAYETSRIAGSRGSHLGAAYVFAEACRGLGKYIEGINALDKSRGLWGGRNNWNKHSEGSRRHLPDAAAVYCLLGKLWQARDEVKKAVDYYVEALKLNPFMWDAFLGLCDTGANIRIANIFKATPEMLALLAAASPLTSTQSIAEETFISTIGPLQSHNNKPNSPNDPFGASSRTDGSTLNYTSGGGGLFQKLNESNVSNIAASGLSGVVGGLEGLETPTGPVSRDLGGGFLVRDGGAAVAVASAVLEPPHAPVRKPRSAQPIELGLDAPPKMRAASSKSRSRTRVGDMDDAPEARMLMRLGQKTGIINDRKRTISGQAPSSSNADGSDIPAQRRSERLINQFRPSARAQASGSTGAGLRDGREIRKAKAPGTKGRLPTSAVGRVVSGNRKAGVDSMDIDSKGPGGTYANMMVTLASTNHERSTSNNHPSQQEQALASLLDLFRKLAGGYYALSHYQCQQAIQHFNSVPKEQRDTPWVQAQIGRAHFEQSNWEEAAVYFSKVRQMAPARLENMELYSTALYHLKKEVELSFLAHELIELDRNSPEAWCAIGNSFSFQKDHDQAIKCIKRATQLDPKFAYAFTLQGHEHLENEELDKALTCYRNAIAAECRHYNAWYGLAKVYERMGKWEMAEKHFRTAAGINPTNAVLLYCIGYMLEKLRNPRGALAQYNKAIELSSTNSKWRLQKARVLMGLQELAAALEELLQLKDIAPDDANVHFLLGRVYKGLHSKQDAIRHFTFALNLDPKAGALIKDAIESLEDSDDEDQDFPS